VIVTWIGCTGAGVTWLLPGGGVVRVVILPVTPGGLVWPSPVMNTVTMLPLAAGMERAR